MGSLNDFQGRHCRCQPGISYTAYKMVLFFKGQSSAKSNITLTKSQSICITTFSASLTNLTLLLRQSRDSSCYVSRPILAPPPLWLQEHTDQRAHDFAHCPDLWRQPKLAKITCARSWRLCGITTAIFADRVRVFNQNEDRLLRAR